MRHLRLKVSDSGQVSPALARLEDGLRCASLTDIGARIMCVKHLDLGRIAPQASPQSLSLLIEERLAGLHGKWIEGGTPAATHANEVVFASPLEARVRLALHLLRGAEAAEWYWPSAVPEFSPSMGRDDNLARIAATLARLPEARVALPLWVATLYGVAEGASWLASVNPANGMALLTLAGVPLGNRALPEAKIDEDALRFNGPSGADPSDESAHGKTREVQAISRWLNIALTAAVGPGKVAAQRDLPRLDFGPSVETARQNQAKAAILGPSPPDEQREGATDDAAAPLAPDESLRREMTGPALSHSGTPTQLAGESESSSATGRGAVETPSFMNPTGAGGLLFMLPVLARLGLPNWLKRDDDASNFTQRVLQSALSRLTIPATDPIWALTLFAAGNSEKRIAAAPTAWDQPLLAARGTELSLPARLLLADDADAQSRAWLAAVRRWLRRAGGIGLPSLVLRPAHLTVSPTHVDLHFRLQDTDLRVRRLGLDIDPGWLPWFGRVVSFHFDLGSRP